MYLPYRVGHLHFLPITIMAICAYFSGIAFREWHWPFLVTLASCILIGFLISFMVSLLIGDAPSFAVVIVGLTFLFIVKTVIENWDWLGGSIGLFGIPPIRYLISWTYLLLAGIGCLVFLVENSQLASKATVIFGDKKLAASLGIESKQIAIFFHSFSGILSGLAGILYVSLIGGVTADFFGFGMIGTLMAMLFTGGSSTMWGVVLTAPLLGGIPILLPDVLVSYKQVIYGGLLIMMICFRPQGLIDRKQIFALGKLFQKNKK